MPIRIAGAGCCLMDILYPKVDFTSAAFSAACSRREGDGGLTPGRLVFAEDAERFTLRPFEETLSALAGPVPEAGLWPAAKNIGGPSVVALIHSAQMLEGEGIPVAFHGVTGGDDSGKELREKLSRTPLDASSLEVRPGRTPSTFVLSDPTWDGGRGERCFVNVIGAAAGFLPAELGDGFFDADIVALGGTGLVPGIHDGLPGILGRARSRGALTVVNTVFDFRAERRDGVGAWPLGGLGTGPGPAESYHSCDLLIMDKDEALRLAGERDLGSALDFFQNSGVGAFAVTRGGESVIAWSGKGRFAPMGLCELPVNARAPVGDTTGCGDAFAGGAIAALALRLSAGQATLDLADALSWGIAAGAFTLSFLGGTFYESRPGEKRELVSAYRDDWLKQAHGR